MNRLAPARYWRAAVLSIAAWLLASTMAATAFAQSRHHISIGLGFTKNLSSALKDDSLGVDFTNAANAALSYRYSITPMIDLTIDSDATVSTSSVGGLDLSLTNSFFGPGVRWYPGVGTTRPYVQANVFLVDEQVDIGAGGVKVSASDSGVGFGLAGGVDIKMSTLLSLPIEVLYLYAKPGDDVSGLGFNVALAFNFGAPI